MTCLFYWQGSETIASWQANLLFEPVKFEVCRYSIILTSSVASFSYASWTHQANSVMRKRLHLYYMLKGTAVTFM